MQVGTKRVSSCFWFLSNPVRLGYDARRDEQGLQAQLVTRHCQMNDGSICMVQSNCISLGSRLLQWLIFFNERKGHRTRNQEY
jgi:hypothetical protein